MRTWVKLHTVILSDPKLFTMPDHLFRVTMNLMAVAGLVDEDGLIGTVKEVAFHLRCSESEAACDLEKLSEMGVTNAKKDVFFLKNWDKFQSPKAPSDSREAIKDRVKKSRNQRKNKQIEEERNDVTEVVTEPSVTSLEEKREEERRVDEVVTPPLPNMTVGIQSAYETLLGRKLKSDEWLKQEAGAAKAIGEKFTVDQLRAAYQHYKGQPFWSDKRLTLNYLAKNMPDFFSGNGHKPTPASRGGGPMGRMGGPNGISQ